MRSRLITEQPFKMLIDREWARAKKRLPILKRKPKFYWADSWRLNGAYGRCHRNFNAPYILVHQGFKALANQQEFVLLLRHEFAHLPRPSYGQPSHGKDFIWWNARLGGTRFVSSTLTELRKKEAAF
jgi:hypothetical protein